MNGKPGDHPYTDVVVHQLDVYGPYFDALIREVDALGGFDSRLAKAFCAIRPDALRDRGMGPRARVQTLARESQLEELRLQLEQERDRLQRRS